MRVGVEQQVGAEVPDVAEVGYGQGDVVGGAVDEVADERGDVEEFGAHVEGADGGDGSPEGGHDAAGVDVGEVLGDACGLAVDGGVDFAVGPIAAHLGCRVFGGDIVGDVGEPLFVAAVALDVDLEVGAVDVVWQAGGGEVGDGGGRVEVGAAEADDGVGFGGCGVGAVGLVVGEGDGLVVVAGVGVWCS